jgi:hypothetical protein
MRLSVIVHESVVAVHVMGSDTVYFRKYAFEFIEIISL